MKQISSLAIEFNFIIKENKSLQIPSYRSCLGANFIRTTTIFQHKIMIHLDLMYPGQASAAAKMHCLIKVILKSLTGWNEVQSNFEITDLKVMLRKCIQIKYRYTGTKYWHQFIRLWYPFRLTKKIAITEFDCKLMEWNSLHWVTGRVARVRY